MDDHSKFRFSASEGTIEIEGSEAFVSKQISDFKEVFAAFLSSPKPLPQIASSQSKPHLTATAPCPTEPKPAPDGSAEGISTGLSQYPNTYAAINGEMKIVVDIPGSTMKEKMRNCALIFGYGRQLCGVETFTNEEVRTACRDHGILDATNFARIFSEKAIFVVQGKGAKKTIKLSHGGTKAARLLAEEIETNAA